MTTLPARLDKVKIDEKGQRRTRQEAEAFGLSLPKYVADVTAPDVRGFTIDLDCGCKGSGIRAEHPGKTIYCHCADGLEAAMAEQVELMTAYAESLRLHDAARRRGERAPCQEQIVTQSLFDAALAEHDQLEARWELLYG